MKRFLIVLVSAMAFCFVSSVSAEDKPVLKLTEGYFQNGPGSMPVNLEKTTKARWVRRGDSLSMWVELNKVAPSPCGEKSQMPCVTNWIIKSNGKIVKELKGNVRWDRAENPKNAEENGLGFSIGGFPVPREIDNGPASLSFSVSKDGMVLYSIIVTFDIK